MIRNLVIAGVGGQGGLSLSRIMAIAAVRSGLKARTGETLGMAQRGGSVFSFVRFGHDVMGPLIEDGSADYLIGLEPLETARALRYAGTKTVAIVDPTPRPTIFNITGREPYPNVEVLLNYIKGRIKRLHLVKAREIAKEMGAPRSANMVMLAKYLKIDPVLDQEKVEEAITEVLGMKKAEKAKGVFRRAYETL